VLHLLSDNVALSRLKNCDFSDEAIQNLTAASIDSLTAFTGIRTASVGKTWPPLRTFLASASLSLHQLEFSGPIQAL
jgi:hypothetical protein